MSEFTKTIVPVKGMLAGTIRLMIALMFPGQGSQAPGMGKSLSESSQAANQVFDTVSEAVERDVREVCFGFDEETLRQTENAQIALFTCGVAASQALKESLPDVAIRGVAGHSVGEYAALVAAGVLSVSDGAKLVQRRGEIMAAAGQVQPGSMAAVIGLDRDGAEALCKAASSEGECVVANDNCPGQLVISGDKAAITKAVEIGKEHGAKRVLELNVSGAFHSPLMAESAKQMAEALKEVEFGAPRVPVFSNVTSEPGSGWASLLELQLRQPVRWTESMQNMIAEGFNTFVECGSGEVLSGLMRRIDKEKKSFSVQNEETMKSTVEGLSEVVA